ncbi:MAG TPA: choice-of-anchor tandem repeat GloVer-containing protein [Candidatus Limnocylindrales bacterium]|nr:choice-of-anchor tandem repeat GloVer-containing protein [Candidatus Limnocylindrales bacterium]
MFAINTNGTGFKNLHSFALSSDGGEPVGGLILSGKTLYGKTIRGGGAYGTIFAVNSDGTGFAKLNTFLIGNEGANPEAGLILSGNTLFGTTYQGGSSGLGTVFAVNTDGAGFTILHNFPVAPYGTNSDGAQPYACLILSGNRLVWDDRARRHWRQWHGVRHQYQWHGFYDPA